MIFHAQIGSPLGPVLLCSEGARLGGLYFVGQPDCPVMDAMPVCKSHFGSPSSGTREGLAIKNFKAFKRNSETDLFGQASVCLGPQAAASGAQAGAAIPNALAAVSVEMSGMQLMQAGTPRATIALFERTQKELAEYFARRRQTFDIPLALSGTGFQKKVWGALLAIAYGQTVSYGDVARAAGLSTQHSRPVGAAVGRNPITIIIPCHRVLSGTGALTGYTGGLERKVALLEVEGFALR